MKSQKETFDAYVKYQSERVKQLQADPKTSEYQLRLEQLELENVKHRTAGGMPPPECNNTSSSSSVTLKVPKGTRDFNPAQMRLRSSVLEKIGDIFKQHGANQIDTPVFELKEILTGKYGDDSKLIYDLKDQGGEILSLRYDLTVPFARYVAMNKIGSIKRYQIAKVYRRDNPAIAKGRYREFYQCDFDVAGKYDSMIPDAECVKILEEILSSLDLGKFSIKLNHRQLLDGIFEVAGVPADQFRGVSSSVDKLDKSEWDEVADELKSCRGLSDEQIAVIKEYVSINGPMDKVLSTLDANEKLKSSQRAKEGIESMRLINVYIQAFGVTDSCVQFDLSLARGLDYYTGVIYEAIVEKSAGDDGTKSVGSIAGGGRYDNLVGMFDANKRQVPCVGVSIGVERIFSILEQKQKDSMKPCDVQVFVASAQKNMVTDRLKIVQSLWGGGLKAETSYKPNPKLLQQLQYCEDNDIPWVIVIGEDEIARQVVKLRNVKNREEVEISMSAMVVELQNRFKSS